MGKCLALVAAAVTLFWFPLDIFNVELDVLSRVNRPPEIHGSVQLTRSVVSVGETATARVFATDPDGREEEIRYFWGAALGRIQLDRFTDDQCTYIAPDRPGVDFITITVYDNKGESARDFVIVTIVEGGKE